MTYDIIPDIHGQLEKLISRLLELGYQERNGAWRHSNPSRKVLFLGDLIDRGARNAAVIRLVRKMQDAGSALVIMGNHELNAILYHMTHPETGDPLRPRNQRNTELHQAFLNEFPLGSSEADEAIAWMKTLPIFLDMGDFRAVHACWNEDMIQELQGWTSAGVLDEEGFILTGQRGHRLRKLVEVTTKGPEADLPEGYFFTDSHNHNREKIRVKWWETDGKKWADIAISVPDTDQLPAGLAPSEIISASYPGDAPPVFFGHYWLSGAPQLQARNALCLDYSAGLNGPLISYPMEAGSQIDLNKIQGL